MDTIAFFKNIRPTLDAMSDADAGVIIKALFAHNAGEDPDLSRASDIAKAVYPLIEESTDRLNSIREAKSRAGKTEREQNRNRNGTETEQNWNEQTAHNHNHNHSHIHSHSHNQDQDHDHPSPDGEGKERELKLPKEAALPQELDQDFVREAFKDFREMRRKMRKPLTVKAEELIIKDLAKLARGDAVKATKILEQSIKKGWQGVFPLKDEPEHDSFEKRMAAL